MSESNRLNLAPFDASEYLDSEEVIAEYLTVALEDPDPDAFLMAVAVVWQYGVNQEARGMLRQPE